MSLSEHDCALLLIEKEYRCDSHADKVDGCVNLHSCVAASLSSLVSSCLTSRAAHILEHLDVRLGHLDEGPARHVGSASCIVRYRTLLLIVKDVVDLLLGELRRRILLVEVLSAESWPRRLRTLK